MYNIFVEKCVEIWNMDLVVFYFIKKFIDNFGYLILV